ncbi:MAG: translation initiation factor eIF-1A [Candidatus Altiarchaeales archaeon HGW-Altiarchaeales-3]|nr:MAG: translation initiation factor eIF-1A [Candidatus Altiarchaeales archaeon HGW-Altiarchaeales-3]
MAYNVKKKKPKNKDVPIIIRVRTPQEGQLLGIVEQLLGERRMRVRCSDGFTRLCRIPGKIRRRIWVKEGGIVLIDPWTVQTNERGDILCLYSIQQENWLRGRGYLNKLDEL